ncbi:hypothetical protein, partial [Mesorhizobium sp. M7A.F.Ca.US.006.04.2.1]|uniref:hypothetical protein n=1 Tax=Mesorhizobium sp. M7A.F.Ca.US.006.04.2.1 TaxID=2496696 RepID=UPI0019D46BE8
LGDLSYGTFLPMVLSCASDPPHRRVFRLMLRQPTRRREAAKEPKLPALQIAATRTNVNR